MSVGEQRCPLRVLAGPSWQQLCESVEAVTDLSGTRSSLPTFPIFSLLLEGNTSSECFSFKSGVWQSDCCHGRGGCAEHKGEVVLKSPEMGTNYHELKTATARLLMGHCTKFVISPSHFTPLAVQARRQDLCPTEKNIVFSGMGS